MRAAHVELCPTCARHARRCHLASQCPDFATTLEDFPVKDKVVGAFGFCNRPKLRGVCFCPVAKTQRARIVGLYQLNLKFTAVPLRLCLIVVLINHLDPDCTLRHPRRYHRLLSSTGSGILLVPTSSTRRLWALTFVALLSSAVSNARRELTTTTGARIFGPVS